PPRRDGRRGGYWHVQAPGGLAGHGSSERGLYTFLTLPGPGLAPSLCGARHDGGRVMGTSPYRTPAQRPERGAEPGQSFDDGELLPVLAIVWVASVVRLVLGVTRGEPFGTEMTLVTAAMVGLPVLAKDGIASLLRRRADPPKARDDD